MSRLDNNPYSRSAIHRPKKRQSGSVSSSRNHPLYGADYGGAVKPIAEGFDRFLSRSRNAFNYTTGRIANRALASADREIDRFFGYPTATPINVDVGAKPMPIKYRGDEPATSAVSSLLTPINLIIGGAALGGFMLLARG